jgi:hypothetical protein
MSHSGRVLATYTVKSYSRTVNRIVIDTKVEWSNNCIVAAVFLQRLDVDRQPLEFLSSASRS